MRDRIHAIMTRMGLSQQDFAARLQMTPASISGIFTGRTNPTINHVMAIHRAFPQINEKWLIFGEGEMEGETPSEATSSPISIMDDDTDTSELGGIFSQTAEVRQPTPEVRQSPTEVRQQAAPPTPARTQVPARDTQRTVQNIVPNNLDKHLRRVKEIRVFYDDNTYETFVPAVK